MECSPYLDAEKSLVFGILNNAFNDAISTEPKDRAHRQSAYRFIKGESEDDRFLFEFYVSLLGYDPEWMRERLLKRIRSIRAKQAFYRPRFADIGATT